MRTKQEGYLVTKVESDWIYKQYSVTDLQEGFDLIRAVYANKNSSDHKRGIPCQQGRKFLEL